MSYEIEYHLREYHRTVSRFLVFCILMILANTFPRASARGRLGEAAWRGDQPAEFVPGPGNPAGCRRWLSFSPGDT